MTVTLHDLPVKLHSDESFVVRLMADAVLQGRPSFLSARATDDKGAPVLLYTRFDRARRTQHLVVQRGDDSVRLSDADRGTLEELRETP